MDTETKKTEEVKKAPEKPASAEASHVAEALGDKSAGKPAPTQRDNPTRGRRGFKGDRSKEFDQKIINIRRVTRVIAGGRRMSFAVAILIGDRKGSVGLGTGKAADTALAINKAVRAAKKNMLKINGTKDSSIPFEVTARYKGANIMLRPNRARGLVVGSASRDILKLAGLKDITGKILSGSKNKLNIAKATLKALKQL